MTKEKGTEEKKKIKIEKIVKSTEYINHRLPRTKGEQAGEAGVSKRVGDREGKGRDEAGCRDSPHYESLGPGPVCHHVSWSPHQQREKEIPERKQLSFRSPTEPP